MEATAPKRGGHGGSSRQVGHVSVLLQEAIDFLAPQRGDVVLDATLGLAGHSFELAKRLGRLGHLIAFDKDRAALELARRRLTAPPPEFAGDWPRITLVHGSFAEVASRVPDANLDGLLADLGVSSLQFGDPSRGFSFQAEGPLDMRMDPHAERTADQVVNHMDEGDLANVIYEFGEERRSRRIARAIVRARPIRTTAHLAQVISGALGTMKHSRLHPATLTFQALRIYVNRELEDLQTLLGATGAPRVLKPGGRLVVISFHSLEDRMVKDALREGAKQGGYELLSKKPVTPGDEEIERNPRARSAKLRAAKKIE